MICKYKGITTWYLLIYSWAWIIISLPDVNITKKGFKCERCGHEWIPMKEGKAPQLCPKCRSAYWNKPRVRKKYSKSKGAVEEAERLYDEYRKLGRTSRKIGKAAQRKALTKKWNENKMTCNGIYTRYKTPGRYANGAKRCQICSIFIKCESNVCPCCHYALRTRPHLKRAKVKWRTRLLKLTEKKVGR